VPEDKVHVILFSESLYYCSIAKVPQILAHYAPFLADDGVFIVRIYDREKHFQLARTVEKVLKVIERYAPADSKTLILVCAPNSQNARISQEAGQSDTPKTISKARAASA
jgi:hypothetical protein